MHIVCISKILTFHSLILYTDKLFRQHVNRDPPYELRSVCFIALKISLDSKRSNLISLGLNGMHVSTQIELTLIPVLKFFPFNRIRN